jgi:hypothetical protein
MSTSIDVSGDRALLPTLEDAYAEGRADEREALAAICDEEAARIRTEGKGCTDGRYEWMAQGIEAVADTFRGLDSATGEPDALQGWDDWPEETSFLVNGARSAADADKDQISRQDDCSACNGIGERPVFDSGVGPDAGDGGIQNCPNCDGTGYARTPKEPEQSTDEQIIEIAARVASNSLHVTRVHELGSQPNTTTIFDEAGLIEFGRALLADRTPKEPT